MAQNPPENFGRRETDRLPRDDAPGFGKAIREHFGVAQMVVGAFWGIAGAIVAVTLWYSSISNSFREQSRDIGDSNREIARLRSDLAIYDKRLADQNLKIDTLRIENQGIRDVITKNYYDEREALGQLRAKVDAATRSAPETPLIPSLRPFGGPP